MNQINPINPKLNNFKSTKTCSTEKYGRPSFTIKSSATVEPERFADVILELRHHYNDNIRRDGVIAEQVEGLTHTFRWQSVDMNGVLSVTSVTISSH